MILLAEIQRVEDQQNISGVKNQNIKVIESLYHQEVVLKGSEVYTDKPNEKLEALFHALIKISNHDYMITERDIIYVSKMIEKQEMDDLDKLYGKPKVVGKRFNGKNIYPKTLNQAKYVEKLEHKDIIFGIGPAGTGKTYLAVAYAVSLLKSGEAKKIILTRPAVEAGESLGYLPGDLKEKIAPYLRPLYDALYDTLGLETTNKFLENEVIEIAPLAYMRGRTLENAVVILDEAQNTTTKQMKMFLTRLGFKSKMIITGDITQTDLPRGVKSGLQTVCKMLKGINEIGIVEFDNTDVVRHPLVAKILERYEEYEKKEGK